MEFANKLIKGVIVKHYKDFILDVRLADNSVVAVFCTGDKYNKQMFMSGNEVFISRCDNPKRRLRYDLQIVSLGDGLVFVNAGCSHQLFQEALQEGLLEDFSKYNRCREIQSKENLPFMDFELITENGEKCYVFINVIRNKQDAYAVFPSKLNFFELQIFDEMHKLREQGYKTILFMLIPRMDCLGAKFSWNLDPIAAARLFDEAKNGLEFVCYSCKIDKKSVTVGDKMDILY